MTTTATEEPTARPASQGPQPPPQDRSFVRALLGFAGGAVTVALAAVLVSHAMGERGPTTSTATAGGTAPSSSMLPAHAASAAPPELAQRVAELEQRVARDPADVAGHRDLARALLAAESWVAAYREAEALERLDAADAEALFVKSVVRLRMGQNRSALDGLRTLLAAHPDHVDGLRVLGLALLRTGDPNGAVDAWERGLEAAGGHDSEIERLLAASRAARREAAAG